MNKNAQTAAENAQFYDAMWSEHGAFDPSKGYAGVRTEFISRMMVRYIHPENYSEFRMLDLGCGSGWLSAYLANYGKVTGIDFAPKAIQEAQERYGERATFVLADAASPSLGLDPAQPFDFVIASEVLEHVEDHQAFMHQLNAHIKPSGWLVLTTPNMRYWKYYTQDKERFETWAQPIENWVSFRELYSLLRQHDFTPIRNEGWPDVVSYGLLNKLVGQYRLQRRIRRHNFWPLFASSITRVSFFMMVLARKKA